MQGYLDQRLDDHDVRETAREANNDINHPMGLTWSGNHFFHVVLENLVPASHIG